MTPEQTALAILAAAATTVALGIAAFVSWRKTGRGPV